MVHLIVCEMNSHLLGTIPLAHFEQKSGGLIVENPHFSKVTLWSYR